MRLNATILESMALRQMQGHQNATVLAQGQLASGLRILRAGVDAAGLSVATRLGAQVRGRHASSRAMQDGLSMLRLADAAMGDVTAQLQRMRELAVRAANGTLTTEDRKAIQAELEQLSGGIDQIVDGTHFNTMRILGRAPVAPTTTLPAALTARNSISLRTPSGATTARLLGGTVSLNLSHVTVAKAATWDSAAIALNMTSTPAITASLDSAPITRDLTFAPATQASLDSGPVVLNTTTAQAAKAATLLTGPVAMNTTATTPALPATLTSNSVTMAGTAAVVTGSNVTLTGNSTDFGSLTVNGTQITLGTYTGNDVRGAAQHIVDRLNQNSDGTFTASLTKNRRAVIVTSTAVGASSSLVISGASAVTGLRGTDPSGTISVQGAGLAQTDYGNLWINGVRTTLGTFNNFGKTASDAAQWIADKINAVGGNPVTATVGGDNNDQVILKSKVPGTAGNFSITGSSNNGSQGGPANAWNGFVTGMSATGTNTLSGVTDLGSVTVNGITTNLGTFANTGKTSQDLAQFIVAKLNANAGNEVVASVGGVNNDQIRLTAKILGTAGNFTIEAASNDGNGASTDDGINGFITGQSAQGTDATAGETDFGAIVINGKTVTLGTYANAGKTATDAAQWIVDQINGTSGISVVASMLAGDRIRLTAAAEGTAGNIRIDSAFNDSNTSAGDDGQNGFTSGMHGEGLDADYGSTNFGTLTINGTIVNLGSFDNNSGDDDAAAQWIVAAINASPASVTATRDGNRITLTADAAGTAGNFTIDASTSLRNGFTAGQSAEGTDADDGETDFGSIVIDGETVALGTFDNTGKTAADALQWILGKVNAAGLDVQATALAGNRLRLTATTMGTAGNFTIDASTSVYNGFTPGNSTPGTNADQGKTDFGTIVINGIPVELGLFDNNGQSAATAAQWIVDTINAAAVPVTASLSGGRTELSADTQGAAGSFTLTSSADSNGDPSDNGTHGFPPNTTASGSDPTGGLTDFGSLTVNGVPILLGTLDGSAYTNASAAAHLAGIINGAGAGVDATVHNGGLVLRSQDAETDLVIGAVSADSNGDPSDDRAIGFQTGDRATPMAASDSAGGQTLVGGLTIQLGSGAGDAITLKTPLDAYAETLGVSTSDLDVSTAEGAAETLRRIEEALSKAGEIRTTLGATMNRIEHALTASLNTTENLASAESRILDADAAQSLLALTRNQIASLSAQAMLKAMHVSRAQMLQLLA